METSYILFTLKPHFNNFNKRVTKRPKLYFYDTGLACNLLKIHSTETLSVSPFRGALFENFIITDLYKQYCNKGSNPDFYFWRDKNGRLEVDCLIDMANYLIPIEIKSGHTINQAFFKQTNEWNQVTQTAPEHNIIIYAGSDSQDRKQAHVIGWKDSTDIIKKLYGTNKE